MDAKPKLLDLARAKLRAKHYSYRTEQQYLRWMHRYIIHHGMRHPAEMSGAEVEHFLTDLAVRHSVSASTQNQALAALLLLYRHVLEVEPPWIETVVRARAPVRVPAVISRPQTQALLRNLVGQFHLIGQLMYGSGLRLMETLRLRIKDIDFEYSQIIVRDGKGHKDRATILPDLVVAPLRLHMQVIRRQHDLATERGYGIVELPDALKRKSIPRFANHADVGTTQIYTHVMKKGAGQEPARLRSGLVRASVGAAARASPSCQRSP